MSKPFFPLKAERVVPILKIDDNDEVTCVQSRKIEAAAASPKVRIIRIVVGSIFKLTMVNIDPDSKKESR